jgi:hypothetical protein
LTEPGLFKLRDGARTKGRPVDVQPMRDVAFAQLTWRESLRDIEGLSSRAIL